MKKLALMILCLLGTQLVAEEVKSEKNESAKEDLAIRVVISDNAPSVLLEARGPYVVTNKETKELLSSGFTGKRFAAYMLTEGLRWGEEFVDIYAIQVTPTAPDGFIYVDGLQYKGNVSLYGREDGTLCVINEVPLEEFVTSTLSMQIGNALSKEAMAAMAIAARTIAYKALTENNKALWDVTAGEVAYYGHGVTKKKRGVEEAVNSTTHIVMLGDNKVPTNICLSQEKAAELANKGLNAKDILKKHGAKELVNTKNSAEKAMR